MSIRRVSQEITPQLVIEGADVKLRRSFGPRRENLFDPFLLFDHFAFNDPIEGPIVGFPQHPHRGIETVTYMLEGSVRHRDSLGNVGVIGPGDLQWMTSGRGILHEELPQRGPSGKVNGFQLWVNLPANEKLSPPRYQEIIAKDVPVIEREGVQVRLVAGEYGGIRGPVTEIAIQPLYMDVSLSPDAHFQAAVPPDHSAYAYVFDGAGEFSGMPVDAVKMLVFGDGDQIDVSTKSGARFVFMAGQPIREPIVPYGPFVMNTEAEIRQVFEDIRNGIFARPW